MEVSASMGVLRTQGGVPRSLGGRKIHHVLGGRCGMFRTWRVIRRWRPPSGTCRVIRRQSASWWIWADKRVVYFRPTQVQAHATSRSTPIARSPRLTHGSGRGERRSKTPREVTGTTGRGFPKPQRISLRWGRSSRRWTRKSLRTRATARLTKPRPGALSGLPGA